jgi:hypothetical protein
MAITALGIAKCYPLSALILGFDWQHARAWSLSGRQWQDHGGSGDWLQQWALSLPALLMLLIERMRCGNHHHGDSSGHCHLQPTVSSCDGKNGGRYLLLLCHFFHFEDILAWPTTVSSSCSCLLICDGNHGGSGYCHFLPPTISHY